MVNFIHQEQSGVTIVTNKVAFPLDLQTIKQHVKTANNIEAEEVKISELSQSKLYLKITGIPYLGEFTNTHINSDYVEDIIKKNYIFNNITLASRPHIIKVSSKLDIAIIWLDIWNIQSESKAKSLINRYFNVGSFITTI